jgi:hypothetical protein
MNEKRKSTTPSAIQVKNRRKTIGIEEKIVRNKLTCKGVNELLTYAVMSYSLIVAYVQFVIMLTELQKVLN